MVSQSEVTLFHNGQIYSLSVDDNLMWFETIIFGGRKICRYLRIWWHHMRMMLISNSLVALKRINSWVSCIMWVICLWLHRSQGFAITSPVSLSDFLNEAASLKSCIVAPHGPIFWKPRKTLVYML